MPPGRPAEIVVRYSEEHCLVKTFVAAILWSALLAACSPTVANDEQVKANAMDTAEAIVSAAHDRAEHLEEQSAELSIASRSVRGQARAAMEREAAEDLAEAHRITFNASALSEATEANIERHGGLLNNL
jgi:hypothetical protein